jgi:hypothetical protein
MKLAYVHVLPLEYYPPATNSLAHFAAQNGWCVRAWTSQNSRGLPEWNHSDVSVRRFFHGDSPKNVLSRISSYTQWHVRVAIELRRWKPDAIVAVEPHSSLALWFYYYVLRGSAPLFIHHHEYYAPSDYLRPGMRQLRLMNRIHGDSLLERAVWVSQTNPARLQMMIADHPGIRANSRRTLPNFPPAEWVAAAHVAPDRAREVPGQTRLVYVGSASLEDTFIAEIAKWVTERPVEYSLHVVGENIAPEVWQLLDSLGASNITTQPEGCPYRNLPGMLARFDAGLVLYRGNTLNFVHNVPNKAIEYLASGLEVWYPSEMKAMRRFKESQPNQRLREVDFKALPAESFPTVERKPSPDFPFTCEAALAQLVVELESYASNTGK